MSRKYELISELYDRTCKTVVSNPQNWQNFLRSACRNYKLRYDEQLLIYAQRPDATAVLEIERWNRSFGRWVNKGARGIAVFADENRARQRLTHYFDISDTHESRYSRPVPLWDMRDEYTDDVIETLESTFGELDNKVTLGEAVMSAAQNAAEDNLPDYLNDLIYASEDSFLEGLDETMIASLYKKVVTNSVAYMMMTRLGIDTGEYFEADDFRDVTNFNTQDTMNALGFATSDIAEMGLSEISKTVMALNRQNRIIEANRQPEYNKDIKDERSSDNERDNIHDGRGLQSSEPDSARTAGGHSGQMVADEENLSERTPQGSVLQSPDERDTEQSSVGSPAEGDRVGGDAYQADGTARGADGADESGRYDELDSLDEQHQELGTGSRESTGNIHLEYYDRSNEDKSLPFFGRDDTIREILGTTPHLLASLEDIKDFYERNTDCVTRTENIKSIFNNLYLGMDSKGLHASLLSDKTNLAEDGKMLINGPMGIGVLYGREELLNAMPPFLTGGEMIESVTRDGAVFAELPHKFEAGTVNAADAVGLHAAIDYVKSSGFEQMHRQEAALTRRAMDGIRGIPSVHVLGSENPEEHCGIITFTVDGVHPHDISEILASDGVAIRAGHHCAQPLLAYLKHPSTARASLAFYNTESEVDRLLDSISTLRERMGYGK